VLPTWREGFPNVLLEAAASELPVVATLTTGARDAVLPGVTGLLVPPGDHCVLAESLLALLRNRQLRMSMGRAARRWVVERFVDSRVLGLMIVLYKQLLSQTEAKQRRSLIEKLSTPAVRDVAVAAD
jgi:glycosyltransferase involved in cell wall biosynthesis